MKRSSQEKGKASSTKQSSEASKLRDMQKAYGVHSKDLNKNKISTTKTRTVKASEGDAASTKSKLSTSTAATASSQQKTRNSVGSHVTPSSRTSDTTTSTRKSYPPETVKGKSSTSKILAASRANYAEKYGSQDKLAKSVSSSGATAQREINNEAAKGRGTKAGGGSNNNSPYKQPTTTRSSQKLPPSSRGSVISTSSRLTAQKQPSLYESETASEPPTEDYDDEDFEEDYESDFEEAEESSVEEDEQDEEKQPKPIDIKAVVQNGSIVQVDNDIEDESTSLVTDDADKSSSIREFENLEKMVEAEERQQKLLEELKRPFSGRPPTMQKFEVALGSGEPSGGTLVNLNGGEENGKDEAEDEEDDEEEDDEIDSLPSSSQVPKQNAFPVTTGFSLSASSNYKQSDKQWGQSQRKSGKERRDGNVVGAVGKAPSHERMSEKMKRTNRGRIIQGMVKLDRVGVEIFHLAPYQYERFMAVFSGTDRFQASTQTDRDQAEESAQTEPIDQIAKWTQKPPTWSTTSSSCDIRIVRQEALGVGSDEISDDLSPDQKIYKQFDFLKNWEQLSKFIIRSSRKMLYVLEAEERIKLPASSANKGSLETIKMNRGLSVLSKLGMHNLTGDGEFVACSNGQKETGLKEKTTNGNKKHTSKNLVTLWSLKEPSMPLYFLRVWGHVSALKLHMIGRMVVSGNKDGSLNIWNLDEAICYHSNYQEQIIRTPSVNTSCMTPAHILPIVGIEMCSETKNTFTIISVDKEGVLITWSCVRSQDTVGESTLAQFSSAWSTIHISVRHQIQIAEIIREPLQITCFFLQTDADDDTVKNICFGTFNGYAATGQLQNDGGDKSGPSLTVEKYQERFDTNPKITCVDISRTLNILAAGCEDGRCRLFALTRKKMVLCLGGGGASSGKQQEPIRVKWSGRRTSVLYVALKDSLLIWDLLTSDMNPWKTIHLKDIQDFVLYSPPHKEYLVIISGNELIISTPSDEVRPLSSRDFARIQSYFSLLC